MNTRGVLVEFIGTFIFLVVIGLVGGVMAPLAIGCMLMVLVYGGGHISGGHYNPAVTLGVFLRGKCPKVDVIPYMVAQVVAAILGGLLVNYLAGPHTPITVDVTKAMIVEFIFTYFLVNNVLNTATSKKNAGNSYYGLAIGFTVVVAAYAAGAISGGAFNPAVACGITVMGVSPVANIWIYFVPNFLAAIVAASVYKFVNPDEI
ncbi:MAG: aquaporin [Planctomycetota bacterium]